MRTIFILFLFFSSCVFAQKDVNVSKMLENINNGETEVVNLELASLLQKYPTNPGLLYVKAYMTTDGSEAVKIYNDIVQKHPSNEWADDALYRVYQYYTITDNTKLANEKLNLLKTKYPNSSFVKPSNNQESTGRLYYVQLGAFSTQDKAQDLISQTKKQGYSYSLSIKQKIVNNKIFYSVLSSKFTKRSDAEKFQKDIKQKLNMASIIISE